MTVTESSGEMLEPTEVDVQDEDDLVEEDVLVEEISIDGMCGVY